MYSFEDIKGRSISDDKIIIDYIDTMELLYIYEKNGIKLIAWEGWLKYSDGSLGHSKKYKSTIDLSLLPNSSAIALAKSTIMQAHTEWEEKPEANNAQLLFFIIVNT